jgi:RNA polymerase sigma factor (TIGR02999 family)
MARSGDSTMTKSDVTRILTAVEQGDSRAADALMPLVYNELRKLAARRLAHERPGQTLQATALVHQAFIRLVDVEKAQRWDSCGHFFAAAAEAMRRILVERARRKSRLKHGRDRHRIELDDVCTVTNGPSSELLAMDEALCKLAAEAPAKAELVKLRYFAGLTVDEAADTLGISRATIKRYWAYARAWLFAEMGGCGESGT